MDLQQIFKDARFASRKLGVLNPEQINLVLNDLADEALLQIPFVVAENAKDLERMSTDDPKYDRLKLTEQRIKDIAADIKSVAALASPLGSVLAEKTLENGLNLKKVRVALGVVGVIYEARPNVSFDVFSLCFKTGNVCVLKGGSDASYSNSAILSIIHDVLQKHGIDKNAAVLLPSDRSATEALLQARDFVDVIIPRGSQGLIEYVRDHARVPVIETGAGIVHTFFEKSGDLAKAKAIVRNSKTRRVSVCNALDCLIVQDSRLPELAAIVAGLVEDKVEIYADPRAYEILEQAYPAELLKQAGPEHFGTEFLDYKMSVKTVGSLNEALEHIANYSSKHSEAIISEDAEVIEIFLNSVDAAAVYSNASTALTDGAQFGLGAEIGISTQKLHARGPMGLEELTSYKWVVKGNGQIRK